MNMNNNIVDKEKILEKELADLENKYKKELKEIQKKKEDLERIKFQKDLAKKHPNMMKRIQRRKTHSLMNPRRKKHRIKGFQFIKKN